MGNCFADEVPVPKKEIKKQNKSVTISLNDKCFDQWMKVVSIDSNYIFKLTDTKGISNIFIEPNADEVERFIRKLQRNPLATNINTYLSKNCILINMTSFDRSGTIIMRE